MVAGLALATSIAGACSVNRGNRTLIGVRKVSLSLSFKDQSLARPVPNSVIVKVVPVAPEVIQQLVPGYVAPTRPPLAGLWAPARGVVLAYLVREQKPSFDSTPTSRPKIWLQAPTR